MKPEHPEAKENEIYVSATEKIEIEALKEKIAAIGKTEENKLMLVGDLMHPGDMAVLVIPIDKAAPKGRLILPQQQVIRDILEAEGAAVCVKEYELRETWRNSRNRRPLLSRIARFLQRYLRMYRKVFR